MNCPSRTDDGALLVHPGWNQNPPSLAPDLTTRQDLGGISNARELKGDAGLVGNSWPCLNETNCASQPDGDPEKPIGPAKGASLTKSGPPIPLNRTGLDASKHCCLHNILPDSWFSKVKNGGLWLLSVFFVASLMSGESPWKRFMSSSPVQVPSETIPEFAQPQPPLRSRKRGACASGGVKGAEYDTPLHVAALFIILGTSTLACAFPVLATNVPRLRIPPSFLFFISHFGTGVLIATAFVHLLPTAFTSLGDPCLPEFWTSDYPAMPGAIALAGIFLITVVEMVFSPGRHSCRGGLGPEIHEPSQGNTRESIHRQTDSDSLPQGQNPPGAFQERPHLRDLGPLIGRSSSMSRTINRMGEQPENIVEVAPVSSENTPADEDRVNEERKVEALEVDSERNDDTVSLSPEQKRKKAVMQVFLLEMGILFHSVFIGMSLSVTVGNEFVILLIAIVFHQTFEGLALGARIASLDWPKRAIQPWLMSLAYGCTTPIGQAIGLATHALYSPESETGLLLVGTMNAISAGLLIFASLVELMSEDFLSDESWRVLRGKKRVFACILVFLGAFFMSLVGAWA